MINIQILANKSALGEAAAACGATAIGSAIQRRGVANIVIATGASQFEMLAALVRRGDVDWSRVTAFHLDEYIAMPPTHPASFRRYLSERFVPHVPGLGAFHFIVGDAPDLAAELRRMDALIAEHPIDVTFAGIGENGHLAFNDPGVADFSDPLAVKVVELESACRQQQVNEGHFPDLAAVPSHAITVTIPALLAARQVMAIVPEARKAEPVRSALTGPVSTSCPASALRTIPHATIYLEPESARLLQA